MDHTEKYLELKPRQASFLRIFRVLSSADYIEECEDFIKSLNGRQAIVGIEWIIFLSMLAQKMLQYNKRLLLLLGSMLEMCLNIFGSKSNLEMFLKNLLRGKVEVPPKTSARFLSIVGLLDNKVELDKNIEPGSNKYFAVLSAMASKLAYENQEFIQLTVENIWKMEILGAYSFWDERYQGNTTQAFIFRDKSTDQNTIIVAFRGTEPFNADDWCTDFDISWCKLKGIEGRVHSGFIKALGLVQARVQPDEAQADLRGRAYSTITEELSFHLKSNCSTRFIVTGHSLGGALAVLFPAVLAMHGEVEVLERLEGVYTFGQPKVGDEKFGKFMEERFEGYAVKYYRFVYGHDVVPSLPFDSSALMYKHFGTCIYINTLYESKIGEEAAVKNHWLWGFSSIVSDRLDAVWELVRSFLLPYMFGAEYMEGWLLKMFRMVGLLFPGLTAHFPQDYINATRLAIY